MEKINTLNHIIKNRRSVFPPMYTGEKISDETIAILLENANWAPTHKLTEPWRFHVITGEARQTMSDFASRWYESKFTGDKYSLVKHNKLKNFPLKSSHIIAICMQRDPKESLPEWEEIAAVSMAVQNIWLSCEALGIGCFWSSASTMNHAGEILDLQEGEKCLGWLYMGMTNPEIKPESKRQSWEDKVKWYR